MPSFYIHHNIIVNDGTFLCKLSQCDASDIIEDGREHAVQNFPNMDNKLQWILAFWFEDSKRGIFFFTPEQAQ